MNFVSIKKTALVSLLSTSAIFAFSMPLLAHAEDRGDFPTESNKCTTAWNNAFHKENGADAPINYDQAWEFVDNCRAGKYAPKTTKRK